MAFEVALGVGRGLAISNNVYDLVDVVHSDDQTFEDVGALLCFFQIELRAANRHVVAMLNEIFHTFFQ